MSELLPCPFCGGEDIGKFGDGVLYQNSYVNCRRCGIKSEPMNLPDDDGLAVAIKNWNTRTPLPTKDIEALLRRINDAMRDKPNENEAFYNMGLLDAKALVLATFRNGENNE